MTVLFADLAGSTALGDRSDPEELSAVTSAFFSAMEPAITAQGGTLEKYAGDALLAVFGVPVVREDDALRALRAALDMRARLDELNGGSGRPALQMRIGVNTGEVLAATQVRVDRAMVSGDAVNVAARLEQSATPGQILVGERTARAAPGAKLTPVGPLSVKGKALPLTAFALEGLDEGAERGLPGIQAPLVGRDWEMEWLAATYRRVCAERRCHLVTVFGDAGVGKSRLTKEWVAWAQATVEPPLVLRGRCLPYGDGVTYWPLSEILKSAACIYDTDEGDVALKKLEVLTVGLFDGRDEDAELSLRSGLAFTLGLVPTGSRLESLPPRQVQVEMRAAWRAFLSALAERSPVMVVVEDIHWADPALLDFLEEVADRVAGPVLMVCPSRPELATRRPTWGGGRRDWSTISLHPLNREDAERLVSALLDIDGLSSDVRTRILERAEGNPLFLEEILRHLIDCGLLEQRDGRWLAVSELSHLDVPDSVQGLLAARLDLLSAREKRVAQVAAVVGRVFWSEPVARLSGLPSAELIEALGELERRELIEDRLSSSMVGQREYVFRHILIRDVAYRSLPRADRAQSHAQTAMWIEDVASGAHAEMGELLAHHWLSAFEAARLDPTSAPQDVEKYRLAAWRSLRAASSEAHRRFALSAARAHVDRALDLASGLEERVDTLTAAGSVAFDQFRGDEAGRFWRDALELLHADPVDRRPATAEVCGRLVELATRWPGLCAQRPVEADIDRFFHLGMDATAGADSEARVRLLIGRAFWGHPFVGSPALSPGLVEEVAAAEEAAAMAERLGLYPLASAALDAVQSSHFHSGRYTAALETSDRRFAILERTSDPWEQADTYAMATWMLGHVGQYERAIRVGTEGFERLVGANPLGAMHSVLWRAVARFHAGDWDGVLADQQAYAAFLGDQAAQPPPGTLRTWLVAATVHEARGNRVAAQRLTAVVDASPRTRDSASIAPYYGWLLCETGRPVEALERLDRSAEGGLQADIEVWHLAVRCDALGDAGRWDEAEALVRRIREASFDPAVLTLEPRADRLEGRAALARGDAVGAVAALTRAAQKFAAFGAKWDRAQSLQDLAAACRAAGEDRRAMEATAEALPMLEALGHLRRLAG